MRYVVTPPHIPLSQWKQWAEGVECGKSSCWLNGHWNAVTRDTDLATQKIQRMRHRHSIRQCRKREFRWDEELKFSLLFGYPQKTKTKRERKVKNGRKLSENVHEFIVTAVTKDHKPAVLTQQKLILSESWRPEAQSQYHWTAIKVSAGSYAVWRL